MLLSSLLLLLSLLLLSLLEMLSSSEEQSSLSIPSLFPPSWSVCASLSASFDSSCLGCTEDSTTRSVVTTTLGTSSVFTFTFGFFFFFFFFFFFLRLLLLFFFFFFLLFRGRGAAGRITTGNFPSRIPFAKRIPPS